MVYHLLAVVSGYILDLIIGDPYWFPHPVRFIGKLISALERIIRRRATTAKQLRRGGVALLIITATVSGAVVWGVLYGLSLLGDVYRFIGEALLCWTILSTRCLAYEAKQVKKALMKGLPEGRKRVGYIVGRDTQELTEEEVIKATIETVAENTTDGIVSPLLYLVIGGPVLGMVFKAVSTLDSMVGYKNEKYGDLGCASARFDDVLNYIPARITGYLMVAAAFLSGLDAKESLCILRRDHANHKSPNCAWSESAAAGALHLQLGGTHHYFGKEVYKPTIGDADKAVETDDIARMNRLMVVTSALALIVFAAIGWGILWLI